MEEPFIFRVEEEEYIDIEIWDKEKESEDRLVCTSEIKISSVPKIKEKKIQLPLTHDDNNIGTIYVKLGFQRT